MKISALVLAATAGLAAAAPAGAVSFSFTPAGSGTIAPGYTLFNDFNAGTGLTGSGFSYYPTNVPGLGAMPAGSDGSQYVAVKHGGLATAALGAGIRAFSLYIGSVDTTNSITLNYGDGSSESIFGSTLTTLPNGNQTSSMNNGLFAFTGAQGKTISSLTFGSGQNSFEFDDLAVKAGAVPEPATWALLILGFGLVGTAARRRRRAVAIALA